MMVDARSCQIEVSGFPLEGLLEFFKGGNWVHFTFELRGPENFPKKRRYKGFWRVLGAQLGQKKPRGKSPENSLDPGLKRRGKPRFFENGFLEKPLGLFAGVWEFLESGNPGVFYQNSGGAIFRGKAQYTLSGDLFPERLSKISPGGGVSPEFEPFFNPVLRISH